MHSYVVNYLRTEVQALDAPLYELEDGPVKVPDQLVHVGLVGGRAQTLRTLPVNIVPRAQQALTVRSFQSWNF